MSRSAPALLAAVAATETACGQIVQAVEALASASGERLDGHGLFADPSSVAHSLRQARACLDAALAQMAAVDWPAVKGAASDE